MDKVIDGLSNGLAAIGTLVCLLAGIGRVLSFYYLFGFQAVTLFIGGSALIVMACFLKLHLIYTKA